jgi:hypothetical protein
MSVTRGLLPSAFIVRGAREGCAHTARAASDAAAARKTRPLRKRLLLLVVCEAAQAPEGRRGVKLLVNSA